MLIIKKPLPSVVVLTTFLLTTSAFAMIIGDDIDNTVNCSMKRTRYPVDAHGKIINAIGTLGNIADDNKKQILIHGARDTHPGELRLVCQDWRNIIDEGATHNNDEYIYPGPFWNALNATYYAPIFNGELIYKPGDLSEKGMVRLKFSGTLNLLKHTFDLSGCEYASKYLVITIDISSFFSNKEEDKNKLLILITPRALVNRKIESSAKHFGPIMPVWVAEAAPVGIFWRLSGCSDLTFYDSLITDSPENISSRTLFQNWHVTAHSAPPVYDRSTRQAPKYVSTPNMGIITMHILKNFMFICEPK